MSKRPRTSTIVLAVAFLGVLALYLLVPPAPVPATVQPRLTPTPSATQPRSVPNPARSPAPSRTPHPSRSATPSVSATPSASATSSPAPSPVSGSPGAAPTASLP